MFNMADGIRKCATIVTLISPYYDVARGTGIITINSPGGSTLKCGMWLWNHDSEFTKWRHPAMW